jgi:hypothetical protein
VQEIYFARNMKTITLIVAVIVASNSEAINDRRLPGHPDADGRSQMFPLERFHKVGKKTNSRHVY